MKFKKLLLFISILLIMIPLASCDFHPENLFKDTSSNEESSSQTQTSSIPVSDVSKIEESSNESVSSVNTVSSINVPSSSITESSIKSSDGISSTVVSSHTPSSSALESSTSLVDEDDIRYYVNDYINYYGYNQLIQIETYGDTFKSIYEQVYNQAYNFLISTDDYETVTINGTEMVTLDGISYFGTGIDYSMAGSVIMTFICDNPIFYFLKTGYSGGYRSKNDVIVDEYINININLDYAKYETRKQINEYIVSMFKTFISSKDLSGYNEAEKAKYINSYITDKINYAYQSDGTTPEDSAWAHNIEGFVNPNHNKGVCECYSKAYKLLSDYVGINSILVTGYAKGNPANGHAWNYTSVNGKWYGMDVTWNDTSHDDYLLVGSNKMTQSPSHTPNGQTYGVKYIVPLPTLETQSYNFILNIFN